MNRMANLHDPVSQTYGLPEETWVYELHPYELRAQSDPIANYYNQY